MINPGASPPPGYPLPYAAAQPGTLPRPASVTAAAVILLTTGALVGLFALFFLLFAALFGSISGDLADMAPGGSGSQIPPGTFEEFGGTGALIFGVAGVIGLVVTVGHLAGGIGILNRKGWGRVVGLVVASIGELLALLGIGGAILSLVAVSAVPADPSISVLYPTPEAYEAAVWGSAVANIVLSAPFVVAYGFTAYALIRRAVWFEERPIPAPA